MTTAAYICPTCGSKLERDLLIFYKHTDQHIVDELKKQNPAWISEDGFCPKCLDFFKREMGKSLDFARDKLGILGIDKKMHPALVNIGVGGVRRRTLLGAASLAAALGLLLWFTTQGFPKAWRLLLIFPFFGAMFGFIQAREEICAVLGMKGMRETEAGEEKISDEMLNKSLQRASRQIIFLSLGFALALTALSFIP